MTVTSMSMPNGSVMGTAQVANSHMPPDCDGEGKSPDLEWRGAPPSAEGYAVTMYDPDSPLGGGYWHWVAFDIPATVTTLPAGLTVPSPLVRMAIASETRTPGYVGACPPAGAPHHYTVTVYALDVSTLSMPDGADNAQVRAAIRAHTIATGTLTATYPPPGR